MRWSKIYQKSFDRTKEPAYLLLADKHGKNAIQSFYRIQIQVKKIPAFQYETRAERLHACRYHESLVQESLHYEEKHRLQAVRSEYCRGSI